MLDGAREGFGGAGMIPGAVFDGVLEGAGVADSEAHGCALLEPEEEPGSEVRDDEGGGVEVSVSELVGGAEGAGLDGGAEGSGFDGGAVGSFVGFVVSVGAIDGSGGVIGCGGSVVFVVASEEGFGGVGVGLSDVTACWVSDVEPAGDAPGTMEAASAVEAAESAAEAGRMPREPVSTSAPAMATQRRAEGWFERGFLEFIRLLYWVKRQATPLPL